MPNTPIRILAKAVIPGATRRWIGAQQRRLNCWQPVGWVQFGSLRRLQPVSRVFGFDRGQCIDRYYIENFLARCAQDIHGSVLEVANNAYTIRYGGARVTQSRTVIFTGGDGVGWKAAWCLSQPAVWVRSRM